METPCPCCPSDAVGTETASVCVECGNAAAAGSSLNLPLFLAVAGSLLAAGFVLTRVRRALRDREPVVAQPIV